MEVYGGSWGQVPAKVIFLGIKFRADDPMQSEGGVSEIGAS
jgi:hypothetical protein